LILILIYIQVGKSEDEQMVAADRFLQCQAAAEELLEALPKSAEADV